MAAIDGGPYPELDGSSIAQLQAAMSAGRLSAHGLVEMYLARIAALDQDGPRLNSILELNPEARDIAAALDRERRAGQVRGPLHGIPLLLKDNIDTADRMMTTAGSLALVGAPPARDATVAAQLRAAGAVLLGKTNMSEWANFRASFGSSSSGWCGRNGQSRNPYVLDRSPSGSSSGSGIATAAALAAAALGTETDGSIVSPASVNGVVGIKPSVGLVSRAGVVPISHSQDTVGPHARSVADAAAVLTAITTRAADPRDPATQAAVGQAVDYTQFLDPRGLSGARLGVVRNVGVGGKVGPILETAVQAMREAGAIIVDPADIPADQAAASSAEFTVLEFEFKANINHYLATRANVALEREGFPLTLDGLIRFNEAHREEELTFLDQGLFLASEARGPLTEQEYVDALATSQRLGGTEGIDAVMDAHTLDALVVPTGSPAWPIDLINGDHLVFGSASPAAQAGYPMVTVPAGYTFGLPVGISFVGRRFSEATLIRLAFAFEQATRVRRPPQFIPTLPLR